MLHLPFLIGTEPCFLNVFFCLQVPVALATSQPERRVKPAIEKLNMANYFDAVVTAEDNGAPEVRQIAMWLPW